MQPSQSIPNRSTSSGQARQQAFDRADAALRQEDAKGKGKGKARESASAPSSSSGAGSVPMARNYDADPGLRSVLETYPLVFNGQRRDTTLEVLEPMLADRHVSHDEQANSVKHTQSTSGPYQHSMTMSPPEPPRPPVGHRWTPHPKDPTQHRLTPVYEQAISAPLQPHVFDLRMHVEQDHQQTLPTFQFELTYKVRLAPGQLREERWF